MDTVHQRRDRELQTATVGEQSEGPVGGTRSKVHRDSTLSCYVRSASEYDRLGVSWRSFSVVLVQSMAGRMLQERRTATWEKGG